MSGTQFLVPDYPFVVTTEDSDGSRRSVAPGRICVPLTVGGRATSMHDPTGQPSWQHADAR
jgi:hypothetical protein